MSFPADHPAVRLDWRRLWLVIGWLLVTAVILLSVTKIPVSLPHAQADKSGHVLAYAVLMFWFAQLYAKGSRRFAIALGLLLLGCGLEVVQHTVGRDFEYADMVADAVGISLGWLAAPPRTPHLLAGVEEVLSQANPLLKGRSNGLGDRILVPGAGVEPACRGYPARDFKSLVSTNFTIRAETEA